MVYIIGVIIGLIILWVIIKAIGGLILKLIKGLFYFIYKFIYYLIAGPALLCEKIFYGITKLFHLHKFIYYLLALCSIQSIIYLCFIQIPYATKENYINKDGFFIKEKKERNKTIALIVFIFWEGIVFLCLGNSDSSTASIFILAGSLFCGISFIYTICKMVIWKKKNKNNYCSYLSWKKWSLSESPIYTDGQIEEMVKKLCTKISTHDSNKHFFNIKNIPFGRATAFISYFNKTLETEDPIYFSPQISPMEDELREYGVLITSKGIYISNYEQKDMEIPYRGVWIISKKQLSSEEYCIDYGMGEKKLSIWTHQA